jgi:hypothetical protein
MRKLLLFLALIPSLCVADEGFLGYGLGILHDADHSFSQNKYAEVGYREEIWYGIYWQNKLGYWGENSPDTSRKASFWGSSGLGLKVDLSPVEFRSGWGLAAITRPDSQLGGAFPQFNGEFYVGVRDKHDNGIGLQYEHISSAGIWKPNEGRDFITLQLSQKW